LAIEAQARSAATATAMARLSPDATPALRDFAYILLGLAFALTAAGIGAAIFIVWRSR
jgi:hypothetical protein